MFHLRVVIAIASFIYCLQARFFLRYQPQARDFARRLMISYNAGMTFMAAFSLFAMMLHHTTPQKSKFIFFHLPRTESAFIEVFPLTAACASACPEPRETCCLLHP